MADNETETTTTGGTVSQTNQQPKPTLDEVMAENERIKAALKEVNNESAARRKQLDAYKEAEQKRKEAEMTETEKAKAAYSDLEKKLAAAEEKHKTTIIHTAIASAAYKANFVDPDDAWRLIDTAKLEIAEDGVVKGVDEAIAALLKAKPYLVRQAGPSNVNATEGRGAPPKPDPKLKEEELTRRFRITKH